MDYKEILQRYYEGRTTLDEERSLRQYLIESDRNSLSADEQAAHLIMQQAQAIGCQSPNIKLRTKTSYSIQIAGVFALCALILAGVHLLSRPTVYGYHNGRPITTLEEAEFYSRQLFAELAVTGHDLHNEDLLKDMFKLE